MKKLILMISLFLVLFSCKKDDETPIITLDQNVATLHHGETIQLTVTPTQACTWSSLDTNVVTVSQTGLVTGVRLGDSKIIVRSTENNISAECVVHLTALSNLYQEPYFTYGQTKEYVKANETRELISETSDGLFYLGENSNIRYVGYLFENNLVTSADVMFMNSTSIIDEVIDFLNERYYLYGFSDGVAFYDYTFGCIIGFGYDSSLGLNALYFKPDTKKSTSIYEEYMKAQTLYDSILK